jgi:uncharacterized protein YbjT (DUF2867 family)
MVLVVGATGLVGTEICRKLANRGDKVRALVRATSSKEKVATLRSCGIETCLGDLKDFDSLSGVCQGADAVISTASSTLSRQCGDSIETVDAAGQMNLVKAAKTAKVERFVYVSFRRRPGLSSPLGEAKREVEEAISSMNFTIVQASWFMEVWLSPALGFDYVNRTARICGPGTSPVSWVSFRDVAEMCTLALRHPMAERRTIEFGGPKAMSVLEVVERFEKIGRRPFHLEHISEQTLRAQFEQAADSMQKSFAALMLGCLYGDAMNMGPVVEQFGIKLTSIDEYVCSALGNLARA